MDTIFALASGPGRSGIAVVRISGPGARNAVCRMGVDLPHSGRGLRRLKDASGALLDEALILVFPAGRSFTGEEVVELHLHGSPAIVSVVLRDLGNMPGLRMAEAGEFTRRAMENGRLDLAQVEGLADLIDAETESQRVQALRVFSGALGEKAEAWRARLIRAAALIEATIDFVDEDVPVDVMPEVVALLAGVLDDLRTEAEGVRIRERIRNGFEVAIVGPPNAGKSTLLNRLAGRDAALTSDIAGTTRDVIEVRMDLKGLPVTVLDTAGLREARDAVEELGIERGTERARSADMRVHLCVPGEGPIMEVMAGDIVITGKADADDDGDGVSGLTGRGVDRLVDGIAAELGARIIGDGLATRERHREAMIEAADKLDMVIAAAAQPDVAADLLAEDLRSAIRAIERIVGRVDIESLLDEIFASFCIGK